jgi:hypothetical protein
VIHIFNKAGLQVLKNQAPGDLLLVHCNLAGQLTFQKVRVSGIGSIEMGFGPP